MITYDVIVVGGGGSGLAAAASAAEHGARVLVLEKCDALGGTTGIAVGSFTASGTRFQQSQRIADDPADHEQDAAKFAVPQIEARNNTMLRAWFLSQANDTLEWLLGLGLSFYGPSPEPPNRVPRMHNVVPSAAAYIDTLARHTREHGGEILLSTRVESLLTEDERVVGVRALTPAGPREFHAARGVVLAGGDYANSAELIGRYKGEQFASIDGINTEATGEGHDLAAAAGAELVNMDVTYGPELRFVPPHERPLQERLPRGRLWGRLLAAAAAHAPQFIVRAFIKRLVVTWQHPENALFDDGAILVNAHGARFCDERVWPDREIVVARQPGKVAYILLDRRLVERYSQWPHFISTAPDIAYAYVADYRRLRPDVTLYADDLPALAQARGMSPETLERAVAEANSETASPAGDQRTPLTGPPWVLLGPAKAYFTTTEGGAAIDQQLRVKRPSGEPIPGLYAVGQNGLGGMILWGHGLHIAWAMTSGRLAGKLLGNSDEDRADDL